MKSVLFLLILATCQLLFASPTYQSQNITIDARSVITGAKYSVVYVENGKISRVILATVASKNKPQRFTYYVDGMAFCLGSPDAPANSSSRVKLTRPPYQHGISRLKPGYTFALASVPLTENYFKTTSDFAHITEGIAICVDYDYAFVVNSDLTTLGSYFKPLRRKAASATDGTITPYQYPPEIELEYRKLCTLFHLVAEAYHGNSYITQKRASKTSSNPKADLDELIIKLKDFADAHPNLSNPLNQVPIKEHVKETIVHIEEYRAYYNI